MESILEKLRSANPGRKIYTVSDPEFGTYGVLHPEVRVPKMKEYAYSRSMPADEPKNDDYMKMDEAVFFTHHIYGETACQVGFFANSVNKLNGLEYHKCSEVLVEFEPVVLIVGHIWDIKEEKIDSSQLELFYVPADTCVELFATTLHFAPCQATPAGVRQVMCQTDTTNTDLLEPEKKSGLGENRLLYQRNKWLLIHPEAAADFGPEAVQGITGENIEIIPVSE